MPEILLKAIEMAKEGDRAMIKLLVEMTMSKPQATEDADEGKERVKVTIRNLTLEHNPVKAGALDGSKQPNPQVIEAKIVEKPENE